LEKFTSRRHILPEYIVGYHTTIERERRQQIVEIVHRACDRHLMISTEGVVSARLEVLEYTARAFLKMPCLGELKAIDENRIWEIEAKFLSK